MYNLVVFLLSIASKLPVYVQYPVLSILSYVLLRSSWLHLRERAIDKTTVLNELEQLGKEHPQGKVAGCAVVAGGGYVFLSQ